MKLKELEEKFATQQAALGKVFAEAKTEGTGTDGRNEYDFTQVTCLGDEVKGKTGKADSIKVAEKVKAMNAELDELGGQLETMREAEQAAAKHAQRESTVHRPPFPTGKSDGRTQATVKSLGELVAADAKYKAWLDGGMGGKGIDFHFPDALPSDFLAKAGSFQTMGAKTLMETGAGWAPESVRAPGFVEMATRPIEMLDIIPVAQTGQDTIKFMEETTRTHGAAERAEGATFSESTFEFTEQSSPVRKITDSLPVTDEQLEDVAMVMSYIDTRVPFGIRQRLDAQCWNGDGTPPNLSGILDNAGIQTQAKGADPVPDTFFKAMTKLYTVGRVMPTHHVMHPTDWEGVRLLRTADGIYIWGSPSEAGVARMWGLPVAMQTIGAAGTGLTGSFMPAWISLFERRGVTIQVGYTGSQFVEGKRTVRGDMRAALALFRPAAFCQNTGL